MHKIYKVNGEEVNVYGEKVKKEEEANYTEAKIKRAALVALSVLVIGINALGIAKYIKTTTPKEPDYTSDYAYGFDINETDWCEPIAEKRYIAPAGYILEGTKCYRINEKGERVYVEPVVVTELRAPEGYVLIGDKCFKINETQEKGRGK